MVLNIPLNERRKLNFHASEVVRSGRKIQIYSQPPDFGQLFRHPVELSGIVSLAPEGLRRHIGAVGFQHDPVQRNLGCHFDSLSGVLEGQHAGEADVPAPLDQLLRHFGGAGIAVEDTGDLGELIHHLHAVLVGIPFVDDDGQAQFFCQFHLHPEGLQLDLPGDVLVVVVKTDLADGLDFGILPAQNAVGFDDLFVYLVRHIRVGTDAA